MNETEALSIYCERSVAGPWAEPLNLVTNVAFLVAAGWLAVRLRRDGEGVRTAWDLWALAALIGLIGIGSGLWHLTADGWAALTDVIPIALFINLFLVGFLSRVAGMTLLGVFAAWLAFQASSLGLGLLLPPTAGHGSAAYLPAYAWLLLLTGYAAYRGLPATGHMLTAAVLFAVSLTARALDQPACAAWPAGTHFLWHLFNAEVLRRLVLALRSHPRAPPALRAFPS
jgi:hypothetical protein